MSDNQEPTRLTVTLTGEYDISRTAELRDAVLGHHTGQHLVIADLAEVTFMDSTGLRSLLEVRAELERRGAVLALANPQKPIRRLFEITNLTEMFATDHSEGLTP